MVGFGNKSRFDPVLKQNVTFTQKWMLQTQGARVIETRFQHVEEQSKVQITMSRFKVRLFLFEYSISIHIHSKMDAPGTRGTSN